MSPEVFIWSMRLVGLPPVTVFMPGIQFWSVNQAGSDSEFFLKFVPKTQTFQSLYILET